MNNSVLVTGKLATLTKLAIAATAKVIAALSSFLLTVLVTRSMSNDDAGLFLLGFTILVLLSAVFRLGLDNVILRILGAHGTDEYAQTILNRSLIWIVTAAIPASVIGMLLSEPIATNIFNKPEFSIVLFWMLLALPAVAIYYLLSMAFQSQHRVVISIFFQRFGHSLIIIAGFGLCLFQTPYKINMEMSAQIYTIAAGVTLIIALVLWFRQEGVHFTITSYKDPELFYAGANLWLATCMSLTVQWAGVLIAGIMVSAEDVAYLTVAQRTAALTSFVLVVVNMVVAPRYAKLWKEGNIAQIKRLALLSTRGMVLLAVPIVLAMLLLSDWIMSLFGDGYEKASVLLRILVIGQCVNVLTGSVGYLLNMSGHERDYRRITMFTGPITIGCCLLFTYLWGTLGAAIATTIGISVQNLSGLVIVKRRLGFLPIG